MARSGVPTQISDDEIKPVLMIKAEFDSRVAQHRGKSTLCTLDSARLQSDRTREVDRASPRHQTLAS